MEVALVEGEEANGEAGHEARGRDAKSREYDVKDGVERR